MKVELLIKHSINKPSISPSLKEKNVIMKFFFDLCSLMSTSRRLFTSKAAKNIFQSTANRRGSVQYVFIMVLKLSLSVCILKLRLELMR